MQPDESDRLKRGQTRCSECGANIEAHLTYCHEARVLCEDCCLDARTPRVRKTHWQYLGSIKAGYLIPNDRSE